MIHIYISMMRLVLWWWLHSTMGSYGRTVLKAAYGKIMIYSTEAVWEMLAREEWFKCCHETSLMVDIPGSTPVWARYTIFYGFHDIKILYVLCFKIYTYYKQNNSGLWLRLGPTMFREGFQPPMSFKRKLHPKM